MFALTYYSRFVDFYDARQITFWALLLAIELLGELLLVYAIVGLLRGAERPFLIRKYLFRRLAPLFGVLGVMLCTAMVIVVNSVMGGFHETMSMSAQASEGDVVIDGGLTGFAHYQELMSRLAALEEVEVVTPVIQTYGLFKIGNRVRTVEIVGIEPEGYNQITSYADMLYWSDQQAIDFLKEELPYYESALKQMREQEISLREAGLWNEAEMKPQQERIERTEAWVKSFKARLAALESGEDVLKSTSKMFVPLNPSDRQREDVIGIVPGIEASGLNERTKEGQYEFSDHVMYRDATLTVVPLTEQGGAIDQAVQKFRVLNEFKSGLYEVDKSRVYVPFDVLQRMLKMQESMGSQEIDPMTGQPIGPAFKIPARTTQVLVRGKLQPDGSRADAEQLRDAVFPVVQEFFEDHPGLPLLQVLTWEDMRGSFLAAVQRERVLLLVLFTFISAVAVAMVGVLFYMIVISKTRDIGILRAVGCSRQGIASIFIGYGLTLGIVGSLLGLGLGTLIATNIDAIQNVIGQVIGQKIWDPQFYYFDRVPARVNPSETFIIVLVAIVASVVASLIPAFLAARLDPVKTLRYE